MLGVRAMIRSMLIFSAFFLVSSTAAYAGQCINENASSGMAFERVTTEYELAAVTCFKTGERTSGMNKICYYDCLGNEAAITIRSTELCPLSIRN